MSSEKSNKRMKQDDSCNEPPSKRKRLDIPMPLTVVHHGSTTPKEVLITSTSRISTGVTQLSTTTLPLYTPNGVIQRINQLEHNIAVLQQQYNDAVRSANCHHGHVEELSKMNLQTAKHIENCLVSSLERIRQRISELEGPDSNN